MVNFSSEIKKKKCQHVSSHLFECDIYRHVLI